MVDGERGTSMFGKVISWARGFSVRLRLWSFRPPWKIWRVTQRQILTPGGDVYWWEVYPDLSCNEPGEWVRSSSLSLQQARDAAVKRTFLVTDYDQTPSIARVHEEVEILERGVNGWAWLSFLCRTRRERVAWISFCPKMAPWCETSYSFRLRDDEDLLLGLLRWCAEESLDGRGIGVVVCEYTGTVLPFRANEPSYKIKPAHAPSSHTLH